jgi:hypothetical protein
LIEEEKLAALKLVDVLNFGIRRFQDSPSCTSIEQLQNLQSPVDQEIICGITEEQEDQNEIQNDEHENPNEEQEDPTEEELEVLSCGDGNLDDREEEEFSDNEDVFQYPEEKLCGKQITYAMKKKAVEYWLNCKTYSHQSQKFSHRKFSSMTSRFKWITSQSLLYRFKAEIEKGETNISKLSRLKTMLYDEFTMCRKAGKLLRDFDLRVMAMNIAKKLEIDNFRCSHRWMNYFKRKFRIVSRKVTTFVARARFVDREGQQKVIEKFRSDMQKKV